MKPIDSLTDDEFAELVQRSVHLPDPPPAVAKAAVDLWPGSEPATLGDLARTAGQIIQAVLSFDSWARPAVAFGMRSAGSDQRHLLFSAGERDVDLRINRESNAFAVTGQILGPDESGTIELRADSDSPGSMADPGHDQESSEDRVTYLDELGEFRLDDIHAGTYRLTLRLGGDEVVLPPIVVGEEPE
jgi:hypothetical protein